MNTNAIRGFIVSISLILLCVFIIPSSSVTAQTDELRPIALYYTSSSDLSTKEPLDSDAQTFSFGPSLMVMAQTAGLWSTQPVSKPVSISGTVSTSIWASGSGAVYFENRLIVNDASAGIVISSGTQPLSQSPQIYTSTRSNVELELDTGDTFGIEVGIYLLGSEVVMHWGSTEYPSELSLSCDSMVIATPTYAVDPSAQRIMVNTTIVPAFGEEDLANYSIQITGPSTAEHITELEPQTENGELVVAWIWYYRKDQTKNGEEYTVTIYVEDNTGNNWSKSAEEPMILEVKETSGQNDFSIGVVILVIVIIICLLIVIRYVWVKKLKK